MTLVTTWHCRRTPALGLVLLAATACGDAPARADSASSDTTTRTAGAPVPPAPTQTTKGIVFDPATVKVGDTVGGLRVDRVDITLAPDDMGYVGDVRFAGEITVGGERMTHPDFPEVKEVCMSVDSLHASRLPSFPTDQRRRWLCFENRDEAARQLGEAGTRGPLTVVIDRYQTVRHFSDAYDTATLVRVVEERRER